MMAAGAAIFNATDPTYAEHLLPGAPRDIVVVANSMDQAQLFIREVRRLLEGPRVDPRIYAAVNWDACRQDLISFTDGVSIRAMPLSGRSTRGPACSMLIFDESGHFQTGGESIGEGNEVYQALAPTVAQFGDRGHILFTSTPKLRLGLFWEQYRAGTAQPNEPNYDPELFVIQRATWEVNPNPNLTRERLERAFPGRPDWVATEYGADFASAEGSFLDPLDILACQRSAGTLPPNPDIKYVCAIDPAFSRDAFAVAIAHEDGARVVVDLVEAWTRRGENAFESSLDDLAALCARYDIREVRTDQFSAQAVMERLARRRLSCDVVPWDNAGKYEAYSRLKALLATRQISLPNDPATAQELMGLVVKPTITGRVQILAAGGGHDDRASVLAAIADMLGGDLGVIAMSWRDYSPRASEALEPFEAWPMELD